MVRSLGLLFLGLTVSLGGSLTADAKAPIPKAKWSQLLTSLDKAESQGSDQQGKMKLVLINKAGKERYRTAIFFQKGTNRRMVQFKSPADVAGLSVLIRGGNVTLYLPQFRRTRRIAAHVRNQPFMGTDLNFDDLGSLQYSKAWKVVGAWVRKNGQTEMKLQPKPGVSKPYKELIIVLRKDKLLKEVHYFNKKGKKVKVMTRGSFKKIKKYMFPHELKVCDLLKEHCTKVIMTKVKMDTGIRSRFFTRRYLKRELDLD
ncbi:MAG: outer membrane lipoprotein-sorting protein [Deltaproteobacteria bacterium]|nr:MAG: outer membrane lipoprotein-sorting protein [Deltaproteobacteria bacterium]